MHRYTFPFVGATASAIDPSEGPGAGISTHRLCFCTLVYFNEDVIDGDVLKEQTIVNREDLFVVSKLASPFHKQQHVDLALCKTLTDLRLDYFDLYLMHWPIAFHCVPIDPTTSPNVALRMRISTIRTEARILIPP